MTTNKKQRFLVSATYIQEITKSPYPHEYPRIMGYYDAYTENQAYHMFLVDHANDVRTAQLFYDEVMVIPVPETGFKHKLSDIYGQLAKFPNEEILEEL